ncbi:unnamed protein product [Pylaiella littoralis]
MESNQRPKRARTAAATVASKAAAAAAAVKKATASQKPKASKATTTTTATTAAAAAADAAAAAVAPKTTKTKTTAPSAAAAAGAASSEPAAASAKRKAGGPLEVGTDAPPFCVKDQDGTEVTLGSFKGQKNVVVFFYPKDNTPGCTKEACKFRDLKDEYVALDCAVLGVSADHEVSHGEFIAKYGLNFSLLADTSSRSLIKAYGASKAGDKIQRSTVLIDKEGKVAAVWNPVSGAEQHPVQGLAKLKEIA